MLQYLIQPAIILSPRPPRPPGLTGPPRADGLSSSRNLNWNIKNIGFFNPHLDKSYSEGDIII